MILRIVSLALLLFLPLASSAGDLLTWSNLPPLPDPVGFAGPFAGVVDRQLIVAGGANFPDALPWEQGKKLWYANAFILDSAAANWRQIDDLLPRPLGYGGAVTIPSGLLCLGGSNEDGHFADVFLIHNDKGKLEVRPFPPLPRPVAHPAAALLDGMVYVAGGLDHPAATSPLDTFWRLDVRQSSANLQWEELEPWPGPPRFLATAGVIDGAFFLFGGVDLASDADGKPIRNYLKDAYRYIPSEGWKPVANMPYALAASPGPAIPLGQSHLLLAGGDTGEHARQIEQLKDKHPGFNRQILAYHPITDTWAVRGDVPGPASVTSSAVAWQEQFVIASGEIQPGIRTSFVAAAKMAAPPSRFTMLDGVVMTLYLAAMVAVGFWFGHTGETTDDYFLGGRRIPWWAAGLSIFGTQLSAITFMAIPALAYRTNWAYLVGNLMIAAFAPIVVFYYLPMYRQLSLTSVYEYLERRFHLTVRLVGSATFALMQLARVGIVLYLPSLALSVVTGIDLTICILVMGLLATLYTVVGGIEAVVWTDVIQVFVLLGGAIASLAFIVVRTPGGPIELFSAGSEAGKLSVGSLSPSLAIASFWVIIIGRFFEQFVPYTADQSVVQRYFTTPSETAAARSIWTNAFLTIPASFTFFSLGTAIWTFYRTHPSLLIPTSRADDIFPWFIVDQLPPGVSGLVIAGLFAAAMSSLDSSLNSVATTLTTDFYRRFRPTVDDRRCLRIARGLTLFLGLLGTASALYMAQLGSTSMMDQNLKMIGLFGGGLAGMFAAGILSRRINTVGVLVGFFVSAATLALLEWQGTLHLLLYAGIGMGVCIVVASLASELFRVKTLPTKTNTGSINH